MLPLVVAVGSYVRVVRVPAHRLQIIYVCRSLPPEFYSGVILRSLNVKH